MIEWLVLATALASVFIFVVRILSTPKIVKEYGVSARFITNSLTRKLIKLTPRGVYYRAFKFDKDRFPTEHSGNSLYYVEPEHLFGEGYRDMDRICNLIVKDLKGKNVDFDCLIGIPLSGSHIGILVAHKLRKPFAVFGFETERKKPPKEPYEAVVGHNIQRGQRALVFDDTSVSGSGVAEVVIVMRKLEIKIEDAYVFLDKEEGAIENLASIGIKLHALTSASTILDIMREEKRMDAETYALIMEDMAKRRKQNMDEFKNKFVERSSFPMSFA